MTGSRARIVLASGRGGRRGRAGWATSCSYSPARRGSGARVVRVIGRPDVARDVIEALMLDRGLRRGFDPAVEREAGEAAGRARASRRRASRPARAGHVHDRPPERARLRRRHLRRALDGERVRVWVHIADVAAHVPEGSLVDREARSRATSVYVPGAVEPMLPHALSSDACSLVPGAERLAVTVELELRRRPTSRRAAFYRSLIRSDERLDYEHVDRIFAGASTPPSPGRAARGGPRGRRGAAAGARADGRAGGRLRGARVRVRRAGQRQRRSIAAPRPSPTA